MTDYTRKLGAWLHDPAEKALILLRDREGHERGTVSRLRAQLDIASKSFDKRADWLAAAADRPQWPQWPQWPQDTGKKYPGWEQVVFAREPELVHPLSGTRIRLPDLRSDLDTEHGFAFLTPYGLPYLAGSGLKGVLRRVMTPHQGGYYQNGQTPHDAGQPVPVPFLAVKAGAKFVFHVVCHEQRLTGEAEVLRDGRWREWLAGVFAHAFDWLGFGAKSLAALTPEDHAWDQAQPVIVAFSELLAKAKAAGAYNPSGPFNQERLKFVKQELQTAIAVLRGPAE